MSRAAIDVFLVSWLLAYVLSSPVPVTVVHVETRPKAAFFVHTPKTAGSFILAAFDTCNITFSCERSLGPAGVLIADPVQVGAASPDTWSAMCYDGVNASSSQAQEQYNSHAQQPLGSCAEWQQPQLANLGLGTRPSALHPLDEQSEKSTQWSARAPNTSFCRGVRHFPLQITLRFHAMLRAAGYTPIVLAGVRHPFTWHISHYSWGLQHLVNRLPASAWQRSYARDYEPQDAACVRWDLQLNVSAGRDCAVQFRRYIYEKAQKLHRQTRSTEGHLSSYLTRMYGRNWSLVQHWAWIRTERLEEDLQRVYEHVTGLRFPLSGQCNLTRLSAESIESIALNNSGADNIARLAAYDGNVHQGVEHTHLNLPPMETLYDQPALELILAGEDQVFKRFFYSTTLEDASQHRYFTKRAGEI